MALLVAVKKCYLTFVLYGSILTTIRIVIGGDVDQVYTGGQGISCCLPWLLITMITLGSTRVQTKKLDVGFYVRVIVSRSLCVYV